jgi:hypothetical protein
MTFRLPKINNNELFAPAVLLFLTAFSFQITKQQFKDSYNSYSLLLAIAAGVFMLKSFVLTFANLEYSFVNKKWFLFGLSTFLTGGQFWLAWLGINILTLNSYPQETISFLAIANVAFYTQVFLAKVPKILYIFLITLISYGVMFFLLYINLFSSNTRLFITFLQITGYTSLIVEVVTLFIISNYFVKR